LTTQHEYPNGQMFIWEALLSRLPQLKNLTAILLTITIIIHSCSCSPYNHDKKNLDIYQDGIAAIKNLIETRNALEKKLLILEEYLKNKREREHPENPELFKNLEDEKKEINEILKSIAVIAPHIDSPPPPGHTGEKIIFSNKKNKSRSRSKAALVILGALSGAAAIGALLYFMFRVGPKTEPTAPEAQTEPEPEIIQTQTIEIQTEPEPKPKQKQVSIESILGPCNKEILLAYATAVQYSLSKTDIKYLNNPQKRVCDKNRLIAEKLSSLLEERRIMEDHNFNTAEKSKIPKTNKSKEEQELNAAIRVANFFKSKFLGEKIEEHRFQMTTKSKSILRVQRLEPKI